MNIYIISAYRGQESHSRDQFINETPSISCKILWEKPSNFSHFKMVLVLHRLHSTCVFLFKHELIFQVKIKSNHNLQTLPGKDQNCWKLFSLWETLTDSRLNAGNLMLQFRWVDMSWTLLKRLSVLNCNRNEHKGNFIQSCGAFLTFRIFCDLTHSKGYLLIDIHRCTPLLYVFTYLVPSCNNHPLCPAKFGFLFTLQ